MPTLTATCFEQSTYLGIQAYCTQVSRVGFIHICTQHANTVRPPKFTVLLPPLHACISI